MNDRALLNLAMTVIVLLVLVGGLYWGDSCPKCRSRIYFRKRVGGDLPGILSLAWSEWHTLCFFCGYEKRFEP